MKRKHEDFHDGAQDGLTPLEPLDLNKIEDFDQLLKAMGQTAFGGRNLGEAADVMEAMLRDPDCTVIGTFSGAMSVAKMGLLICEMIDRGWLKAVITTGALVAHGFIETLGRAHYKYPENVSDRVLFQQGYNRIYDTLEMESNLDYAEDVFRTVLEKLDQEQVWSSSGICRELGKHLAERSDAPGILRNAYLKGVPVFIPAFTDSELGLDLAGYMVRRALAGRAEVPRGPGGVVVEIQSLSGPGGLCPAGPVGQETGDLHHRRRACPGTGPSRWRRTWSCSAPAWGSICRRCGFNYGVRICPEPAHWGGLSGCTYKEGVSWGKFVSPEDGGRFAEVLCDATIAWPLLLKGVSQRLEKEPLK